MLVIIGAGAVIAGVMALLGKKHALRVVVVAFVLGLCYRQF